jgi:PIN domain nuclease of toxin-antitoxin system
VRVLIDSHVFLWYVWDDAQLTVPVLAAIEDSANTVIVSTASMWEIAIKFSIGELSLKRPLEEFKSVLIDGNGFELLHAEPEHIVKVSTLPFHHKDPFDRMLIAQSLTENIPIVSADAKFDLYGVRRLWNAETNSTPPTP